MNYSAASLESLLCRSFQEEAADRTYIVVSISLLSLIGVLGVVGNILVLMVYCQSPPLSCCLCSSLPPHYVPRFRRGLHHSQRKLLVALAVVDLLTTSVVLPCDIGHKVFTLLNIPLYCDTNAYNFAFGFVNNARNVMFALEGSILTSIAIDRFLVIGCPYVRAMGSRKRPRASNAGELSSGQAVSGDATNRATTIDGDYGSATMTIHDEVEPPRRPEPPAQSPSSLCRCLCVLLPITLTTLTVVAFEVAVFLLHIRQHRLADKSLPAARLRHFLNRLYLISTIVTLPLVCGPYVCIFLAIRSYDRKRAQLHRGGLPRLPRSRRTALTLFITTLVFYLTLLPVLVVHFGNWSSDSGTREDLARDVHMHSTAVYIHHEFYYINNAVNFFIYSLVSPAFRRRLGQLCKRIR